MKGALDFPVRTFNQLKPLQPSSGAFPRGFPDRPRGKMTPLQPSGPSTSGSSSTSTSISQESSAVRHVPSHPVGRRRVVQEDDSDKEDDASTDLDKPTTRKAPATRTGSAARDKDAPKAAPAPTRQAAPAAAQKPQQKNRGPPPAAKKRARERQSKEENGRTFTCMGCKKPYSIRVLASHHMADDRCKTAHHRWLAQAWERFV